MQRSHRLRCIVSNCGVYAKKKDPKRGSFSWCYGLEPQVRVRGARGALPVAGGEKGDPTKPALWGEEKPRYSRNFPLAENGEL